MNVLQFLACGLYLPWTRFEHPEPTGHSESSHVLKNSDTDNVSRLGMKLYLNSKEVAKEQATGQEDGDKAAWAKFLFPRIKAVADYSGTSFRCVCDLLPLKTATSLWPTPIDGSDKVGVHDYERNQGDALRYTNSRTPALLLATASIIRSIRAKFKNVRILVPSYAKSAATLMDDGRGRNSTRRRRRAGSY